MLARLARFLLAAMGDPMGAGRDEFVAVVVFVVIGASSAPTLAALTVLVRVGGELPV